MSDVISFIWRVCEISCVFVSVDVEFLCHQNLQRNIRKRGDIKVLLFISTRSELEKISFIEITNNL
jgi:hypothetical protein